jgi:hypothetical protein
MHNPNLVVVCDAEQIIKADMDKGKGNLITYTAGAIEDPKINRSIVDVLEGTMPAFRKRDSKYHEDGSDGSSGDNPEMRGQHPENAVK